MQKLSQIYAEKQNANSDTQKNKIKLCPKFESLCPIEQILISQIIPVMFIVAKVKSAQHGLKGPCGLVSTDLKKVQTILPRL